MEVEKASSPSLGSSVLPTFVAESGGKQARNEESHVQSILSSGAYAFCSVSMVLINKFIAMSVDEQYRHSIPNVGVIWVQCLIAVVILEALRNFGYVEYSQLQWPIVKQWIPVNLVFIGMLSTGFLSFVYLSVPMVNIMKNLTNVITIFGDWFLYHEIPTSFTVLTIVLMTVGAVMAGVNDLQFSLIGYIWMVINCALTAFYTLYMRYVSVHVKLSRTAMVFYNNILSVVILAPICAATGQFQALLLPQFMTVSFIGLNIFAGILGVCLNFASLWCVGKTSATNYAIVGSLCKIPVLILGFVVFYTPVTTEGLLFIMMGTMGGLLYAYSKLPVSQKA